MQDMIKKIIAVDRKARETVDEAKKEKENVEKKLYEAGKDFEELYNKKALEKIETMKEKKQKEFEEAKKEMSDNFEKKKKILEDKFNEFSDKWAEEIAMRAIKD